MDISDSRRIKQIRDNTEKMADAFTRIADALERLTEPLDKDTNVRSKDCETCIWSTCNYNKVPWGEDDEPQTDNLKAVKALQEYLGIKREPTLSEMVEEEPQTERSE